VNDESERMSKKVAVDCFKVLPPYRVEGLRKTTKIVTQNSRRQPTFKVTTSRIRSILYLLAFHLRFDAVEENIPLFNLHPFSSHFNAITRSVTGNMAGDCVALKAIEAART
jgi:hypothetical protein